MYFKTISLFCHVGYLRVIPWSPFIMDGLLTNLEATVETYELRTYGGYHQDRQGDPNLSKTISFRLTLTWNGPYLSVSD